LFKIPLAPPDYPFTGRNAYAIQFVFRFAAQQSFATLSQSLEQTLTQFYQLTGELVYQDNCAFVCSGTQRVHLECFDHSGDEPPPLGALPQALANFHLPIDSVPGQPLARFALHQYKQGSLLVVNISHCLVDGYSFFYFLTCWAKQARGESFPRPCHHRDRLIPASSGWQALAQTADFEDRFSQQAGVFISQARDFPKLEDIPWQLLSFADPELIQLATDSVPSTTASALGNPVICAYLWQKFTRTWHVNDDPKQLLTLNCAVDFRRIFRKTIPGTYFGNGIRGITCSLTKQDVLSFSLMELAAHLRKQILGVREADIWMALNHLEAYRHRNGIEQMDKLHVSDPHTGLLVTNLSRLPVKEINFGQGPPQEVMPLVPASRVAIILPGAPSPGILVAPPCL
jgi:Transferase family